MYPAGILRNMAQLYAAFRPFNIAPPAVDEMELWQASAFLGSGQGDSEVMGPALGDEGVDYRPPVASMGPLRTREELEAVTPSPD